MRSNSTAAFVFCARCISAHAACDWFCYFTFVCAYAVVPKTVSMPPRIDVLQVWLSEELEQYDAHVRQAADVRAHFLCV